MGFDESLKLCHLPYSTGFVSAGWEGFQKAFRCNIIFPAAVY